MGLMRMYIDFPRYSFKLLLLMLILLSSISQVSMAFNYTHPTTPSLNDIPDNTWILINQGGVTAPGNIMSYSGGWYDPQNHQFCIFGGGHWDYSGNEVWCFDIATLTWREMYTPDVVTTQSGDQGAYNNYDNVRYPGALFSVAGESISDANPMSKHTYDQMEFVEGLGPVVWGGYSWGDGSTTGWCANCQDTWAFNFTSANWQYLYNGTNPSPNTTPGVGSTAFSIEENLLYVLAQGVTWTFNPADNSWTQLTTNGSAPYSIEMTMEYDSNRNVLYTFGGTWPDNPNLYRFDIASSTWTQLTPDGSGPDTSTVRGPGMAYDMANDVLLIYKSGNIWAYDPNNNSWSQYTPAQRPPADGWDVYGRFRYDPINNGAWYHSMQDNQHTTWFYRFSNSNTVPTPNTPPSVTFNANPKSVSAGGQSVLTWNSNADNCVASGDWSDSIGANGTSTITLSDTSTFVLTCTLNGVQVVNYVTILVTDLPPGSGGLGDLVQISVTNQAGVDQGNIPVTFGHVFRAGDVASGTTVGAKLADETEILLQIDNKATHADGSLRHAVMTAILPTLATGATVPITLFQKNSTQSGSSMSLSQLLATDFDTTVDLNIGGTVYSASVRDFLQNNPTDIWLSGPLVSEWLVNGSLRTIGGSVHPHLTARFAIRAYSDLSRVRVSVIVENSTVMTENPQTYIYDASVTVRGQGNVLSQDNVSHYRQGRWHRVFWWGEELRIHITHDKNYLESTRAVPTYNPEVTVPNSRLDDWFSAYNQNSDLMEFGLIDPYMPGPGNRTHGDIAPLPGWTTTWLLSQDPRAKAYMLGTDSQAGSFNIHFRDENTGLPIRATDHTYWGAYVSDDSGGYFPAGLNNGFPDYARAEPSHQPDIGYIPYLISGDYYYLEEMQFWASWNIMYGGRHDGANGYVVWDQVRGQAWSLRSIAHAAYATPDDHPLKAYYLTILDNNRQLMDNKWLNPTSSEFRWPDVGVNPLGFITIPDWLGFSYSMSTWMDDYLTWSVGHIVALGFTQWTDFRDYKVRFPVGRTTDEDSCWILASTNWPNILDTFPGGGNTGNPVATWQTWKEAITYSSSSAFYNAWGENIDLSGSEQAFLATTCASTEMYGFLAGVNQGEMIAYTLPDSYIANLQAALAVSVEANYPNAQAAFDLVQSATNLPDYTQQGRPAWALVPYTGGQNQPSAPSITLTANPMTVERNGSSTLSWFAGNATSCTASGDWTGSQDFNGSLTLTQLTVDSTYTLVCEGTGGSSSRSVTITVNAGSDTGGDTGGDTGDSGDANSGGSESGGDDSGGGLLNISIIFCLLAMILLRRRYLIGITNQN